MNSLLFLSLIAIAIATNNNNNNKGIVLKLENQFNKVFNFDSILLI
jgi:hypothetical protein